MSRNYSAIGSFLEEIVSNSFTKFGSLILPLFGFHEISIGSSQSLSAGFCTAGAAGLSITSAAWRSCDAGRTLWVLGLAPLCSFLGRRVPLPFSSSSLLPSVYNSSPDIHWSSSSYKLTYIYYNIKLSYSEYAIIISVVKLAKYSIQWKVIKITPAKNIPYTAFFCVEHVMKWKKLSQLEDLKKWPLQEIPT